MTDSGVACCVRCGRCPLPPSCCWCSWRTEEDGRIVSARQHTACPTAGKNSPRLCSPPFSSSASDGCGQKQYLDMAADVPQTSPGRTGRDSEGNFWLGTTPRRGARGDVGGGLQTMWFMRTLEGEHEGYLDSAGRLIYGEVPL